MIENACIIVKVLLLFSKGMIIIEKRQSSFQRPVIPDEEKIVFIHAIKTFRLNRNIAPHIRILCATWKWVVKFMPGCFTYRKETW